MEVAVAGVGYVGLTTAVCLADIGHTVACVDIDKNKIKSLNDGKSPIYENGLNELLNKNKDRLSYTTEEKKAYQKADVIFVCTGTPSRSNGSANLDYILDVVYSIKKFSNKDKVIVVKSTVPVGTCDKIEKILNDNSRHKFYVVSNPEFFSQGSAVKDMLLPSRIIVGTEDLYSIEVMKKLYEPLTKIPYCAPYLLVDRRSAEMSKYAANNFLALKIAYINEVANLCEMTGADIKEVTKTMSYDKRIGDSFLNAGIGFGGSCFTKDTKAFSYLGKTNGYEMKTVSAIVEANKKQNLKLLDEVLSNVDNLNGKKVAVLGLSFKPGTDDIRESVSIINVDTLLEYGAEVNVYDPMVLDSFKKLYGDKVSYYDTIDEAIKKCDFAMIMTEWDEIVSYDLNKYRKYMKKPIIFDGRNCYNLEDAKKSKIVYYSIGRKKIGKDKI